MVDAIVSFAVQRLGDFLIQEANVLFGVKKQVVWLQNELMLMQAFLKNAEQKQDGNERIRIWVSEIQDIAYDTEDVIEAFIFKFNRPIRTSERGMSCNFVTNCFGVSTKADLYGIGKDIEDIKSRVLELTRQRETYGINNIGGKVQEGTSGASILRDLRRLTTSYADGEDADGEHVVGLEDDAQILQEKLFRGEPQRIAMSILGMGGLGKTTLARKLYDNNNTKFDLQAWVCVSQEWQTRDLLERLIKSFKGRLTKKEFDMLDKMKDYDMEQYLRNLLEGRQYLVVIDDVWQIEAWQRLRNALPDNKNGSRIIITTRKKDVAEISGQAEYVHKLRFLSQEESWQLFCKKAFQKNGGLCPQTPTTMETLGREMTEKCCGLPLTIIVLGGIFSTREFHEWHAVKERLWQELKDDSIDIASVLALSYKDLPHKLRSCFLYLGIFPEDFEIDLERLIQLWIAEEFITKEEEEGRDLEEVAEDYMEQLIRRSLIQVVKRNWRSGSCRVHDLLRDLAINKAKKLNFLHYSNETLNSAPSTMASSHRRIAFRSRCKSYMSLDPQKVRTLSVLNNKFLNNHDDFNNARLETLMLMNLLYPRFRLLRVLDLEGVLGVGGEGKKILHEAIGELIHLRYLGLNRTNIGSLPESIGNLQALQTLNLWSNNEKMMLPKNLCKLKQLRYVGGSFATEKGSQLMTRVLFEELTNLRFLQNVNIEGWLRQQEENEFCLNAFAKLQNLKILEVEFGGDYMVSVQPLLNCSNLVELVIDGGIKNLPEEMHKFLPNLKYFNLRNSKLEQDPMPVLEMLPNLLVLGLNDVRVNMMTCTATGFPHLQVLTLGKLLPDTRLHVEEGAMPELRALTMVSWIKDTLPDRLRSLPDKEFLNWDSWAFFD